MIVKEIMKDEDIHLRLDELAMESDPEFKKEQGHRSLADEESESGFMHKIAEENAEDLHEHASHSRFDIKEHEEIILRLNELIMDSNPQFKAEQDDQHEDLNAHRSLADEECDGGFKPKIEEENAEDLHEHASHSRFDIKKHDEIILRLNELIMDSNPQIKAEQDDQHEDLNADRGFKPKIEEENAEDLDKDASHSTKKDPSNDDVGESHEAKTTKLKKLEKEIDPSDSGLGTLEVLEEIVVEYHEFIDYAIEMFKDGEKKKREECWRVLLQVTWSLNKGYKRVNNEMEWLKKNDEIETFEAYFNKRPYITEIFSRIEEVNATFYSCIEEDLSSLCVDKLSQCKAELGEWILKIRELKANKIMHEEMEILKQRCISNDSVCCSVPHLPDGFEK